MDLVGLRLVIFGILPSGRKFSCFLMPAPASALHEAWVVSGATSNGVDVTSLTWR